MPAQWMSNSCKRSTPHLRPGHRCTGNRLPRRKTQRERATDRLANHRQQIAHLIFHLIFHFIFLLPEDEVKD
jgi:hypothetical protein